MLDKIDETLNILEEKLFRPGFRTDDFKRIKKAYRESLNDNKKSINYLASVALNEKCAVNQSGRYRNSEKY